MHLASASRAPSYGSVAAGQRVDEWIERDLAVDLIQAIALLETSGTCSRRRRVTRHASRIARRRRRSAFSRMKPPASRWS